MDRERNEQGLWHGIFMVLYAVLVAIGGYWIYRVNDGIPTTIPLVDIALISLANFRLVRLFTYDSVSDFIRLYFRQYKTGPGKTMYHLLSCPWCTGVWMALFIVTAYFLTGYAWYPIFILAIAGIGTYLQIIIWKVGLEV